MTASARPTTGKRPRDTVEQHAATEGYYGKPIVRAHIWEDLIGWYFFTGGLAGAASVLAAAADFAGHADLAKHARRAALIGLLPSPVLLIADLGRPARFYNMLRVFKPTSPMSVGSWLLGVYGPAAAGAAALAEVAGFGRLRRTLDAVAGFTGAGIATYTAVLVADTATPVWHEARRELPFVFAASAAAAGAATTNVLATASDRPSKTATRVSAAGAVGEIAVSAFMHRRLGELNTYDSDPAARRFTRLASVLSIGGALGALTSRGRVMTLLSSSAVIAGSACTRFAVLRAGTASANDPRSVLVQQRNNSTG